MVGIALRLRHLVARRDVVAARDVLLTAGPLRLYGVRLPRRRQDADPGDDQRQRRDAGETEGPEPQEASRRLISICRVHLGSLLRMRDPRAVLSSVAPASPAWGWPRPRSAATPNCRRA